MSTPIPPADVPPPDPGPPTPEAPTQLARVERLPWQLWVSLAVLAVLVAAIALPDPAKPRDTACRSCCLPLLKQVDGAVQQWALENRKAGTALVTSNDILPYIKGGVMPTCPGKGTYILSTVSSVPRCTHSNYGHTL